MKNLLVTGGCGFIGSNYINYIFKKYSDYNIINIDAMYYCASEKNIHDEIINSESSMNSKDNTNRSDEKRIDNFINFLII